ncbi:MAG: hypothetical protein FJZ78_11480 [Bacteroidetes bacterium]|nr:hypothetical protein [Bacteroidota bacterium]
MRNKYFTRVVLFLFILHVVSCQEEETILLPAGLQYAPNTISLTAGESVSSSLPSLTGTPPFTFTITTSPDAGGAITIGADGIIQVSSQIKAGNYTVNVRVSNKGGNVDFNGIYIVNVKDPDKPPSKLTYTPASVEVQEGKAFTGSAPVTEGTPPFTFSLVSKPANSGITIDNSGIISATALVTAGTYEIDVTVTNSVGSVSFPKALTLKVSATVAPPVSFATEIKPILQARCVSCHSEFSDYTSVKNKVDVILNRVQREPTAAGFMPQGGNPLTQAQIDLIKKWKAEGLAQ